MLNTLLKMLMALATFVAVSSDNDLNSPSQDVQETSDILEYLDYSAHKYHDHGPGEMCGFERKIRERIAEDPEYAAELDHYKKVVMPQMVEEYKARKARGQLPPIITVPVVFHVVHREGQAVGTGLNLDDQTIFDAVNTLNEDFQALNDGYESKVPDRMKDIRGNAEMHFCLAEFDPSGAPTNGINRIGDNGPYTDAMHERIKRAHGWDSNLYYNIYVVPITSGAAGYAYLPSRGIIGNTLDGTVVDNAYVGAGVPVITHEVGHSFGLYHTFQGGCGGDDGIEDTPTQGTTSRDAPRGGRVNCTVANPPTGPISCDDIEHNWVNFMDYTSFSCMAMFTQGQVDVMRSVMLGTTFPLTTGVQWASREALANNSGTASPSCTPAQPPGGGGTNPNPDPIPVINDAGIRSIIEPSDPEFCSSGEITPIVLLTNDFGEDPLTSCEIKYRILGVPGTTTFNWSGNLATNEQEEVTLAPFTSPNVNYDLTIWTTDPNGQEDDNGFNNEKTVGQETIEAAEPNVVEDFEPSDFDPSDKDITLFNPDNDRTWERTTDVSAYGLGGASTVMRNYQYSTGAGREDWLVTPLFDFSTINNPRLTFDVAAIHLTSQTLFDSLEVRVSTDCGETYPFTVWKKGGLELATVSQAFAPPFVPEAEDWRNETVSLTQFEGTEKLYVAVVNKGNGFNNIYLDNLNLAEGCASNVTVNFENIACGGECTGLINLNLTGFTAPPQITWNAGSGGGSEQTRLDLCPGQYNVTIVDPVFDCEFVEEITITQPPLLFMNGSVSHEQFAPNTNNGAINLFVDGGTFQYDIQWDDGVQGEFSRGGLAPGIYCVTVSDSNGCAVDDCFEILPFGCSFELIATVDSYPCAPGEFATVTVQPMNNQFPVSWNWEHDFFLPNQPTVMNVPPGVWSVFGSELLSDCEAQAVFEIPEAMDDNPLIIHESNAGASNGSIDPMIDGGSDNLTYSWDYNGETEATLENLPAGDYTVTITDEFTGCEFVETYTVLQLDCDLEVSWLIDPVTCFSGDDGGIMMQVSGGTGNYNFNWTDQGLDGSNVDGLESGTYQIIVEDANGCQELYNIFVPQPSMITVEFTVSDESVPGAQDGIIETSVSGGTPGYTYDWSSNAGTDPSATGLGGGTYNVTVTDANGCTTVQGATVIGIECPEFIVEGTPTDISCNGENTGSISVSVEGPLGPFTYAWAGGQTTSDITDLGAGDYELIITDEDSGCTTTYEVTLSEAEAIAGSINGGAESQLGAGDGSVSVEVSGGTGSFTYTWTDATGLIVGSTAEVDNLAPGEYCVIALDENSCSFEDCVTVAEGADPCIGFAGSEDIAEAVSCNGGNDGSATVLLNGGTAPFTYLWSDEQTEEEAINLAAGDYTVTVTDANGCETIISVTVEEPEAIEITTDGTNESIQNAADGSITAMVSGGSGEYTFSWTGPNGFTAGTMTITDLAPGEYCVDIFDGNECTSQACYEVLAGGDPCANSELTVELEGGFLTCAIGSIDLVAQTFGGEGEINYEWQDGTNGPTFTVDMPGLYEVLVTDAFGCTATTLVEIGQNVEEPDFTVSNTAETLPGANDGTVTADIVGQISDFTVVWFVADAMGMPVGTGVTLTDLPPGEYCAIVTNNINGCFTEMCTEVVAGNDPCADSPAVEINNLAGNMTITCILNEIELVADAAGGDGNYTYMWSTGSTASNITVTEAGTYTVIVTDGNDCIGTTEMIIEDDLIEPTISVSSEAETSLGASDGSVSVDVTGEVEIKWFDADGMIIGTTSTIEGLAPGVYCAVVTGANGCESESCIEVFSGSDPCIGFAAEINNNLSNSMISCAGADDGTLTVEITGGTEPFEYEWSNGQTTAVLTDLGPGLITGVIIDANNCQTEVEFEIVEPEAIELNLSGNSETSAGANDGSAEANVSGGTGDYTYSWTGPNGFTATSAVISDLAPGEYCVEISDDNNCTTEDCFEVSAGDDPCRDFEVIAEGLSVSCFGSEDGSVDLEVLNGAGPYNVVFMGIPLTSFDGTTFTSPTILPAGVASFTIVDANGCEATVEVEIESPDEITAELTGTMESQDGANDGSITAVASGGTAPYTYEWNNGLQGPTIENLSADLYCVTITDENGCILEAQCFEVLQGADPCADFEVDVITLPVSCNGGSNGFGGVSVFNGAEPFEIMWSDGGTDLERDDFTAGTFTYILSDANGCQVEGELTVEEPDRIEILLTPENESLMGAGDGSVETEASGGTGDLTFFWTGGGSFTSSDEDLDNLAPGVYCLVAVDANNCESEEVCVEISTGADPCANFVAEIDAVDAICFGDENGSAEIFVSGGTAPFEYLWSNGETTSSTDGLGAGLVSVLITDLNGCTLELEAEIDQPQEIVITLENTINESDVDANDGSIEVSVTGGVGPYTYQWSNGATAALNADIACGDYQLLILDGNGCEQSFEATVGCSDLDCASLGADFVASPVSCFGDADGSIEIMPTGGTAPYEINYNNGLSGTFVSNLNTGVYAIVIVDANGCEFDLEIEVPQPAPLVLDIVAYDGTCGTQGIIEVTPSGGTEPYSIEWSTGATGGAITGLETGEYTVTITDANGCVREGVESVENNFTPINFEVETRNVTCNGGTDGFIAVTVTEGVGPFTYAWSNGSTDPEIFELEAGMYTLIITDGDGCEYALSRDIIQPNPLELDYIVAPGGTSTTFDVTLNVTGGTAPYSYDWDDGSNSVINVGVSVGTYNVLVTDDRGCQETFEIVVDGVTSVGNLEIIESFNIFPNPTSGLIQVNAELSRSTELEINVYNVLGQEIIRSQTNGRQINESFDLSQEAAGTYYIKLGNEQGAVVEKIIKM